MALRMVERLFHQRGLAGLALREADVDDGQPRQEADDGDHDQQLDQREALLGRTMNDER